MYSATPLSTAYTQPRENDTVHDVLILGAGPAGISAGNRLKDKGNANFLILEGRDRVGGRTLTDPLFGDLGASWTHINDPRVLNDPEVLRVALETVINPARKKGYTLSYDTQNTHIFLDGQSIDRDRYMQCVDRVFLELQEIIRKEGRDMSIGEAKQHLHSCDTLTDAILRMECGWGSTGWDYEEVSTAACINHYSLASGVLYQQGLGNVIKEQAEPLQDSIRLNQRVTAMLHGDDGLWHITVKTPEGEQTFLSKKVISTLPPPVLTCKEDGYKIKHSLPASKVAALKALPSGAMNKIILKFPHGYLEKIGVPENAHYEIIHRKLGNMFFLAPAGKDTLVGLVGGQQSIALEQSSDQAAAAFALDFLETVPQFQNIRGQIVSTKHTQWYSDVFARGSYSVPKPDMPHVRKLAAKPYKGLYMAGEAFANAAYGNKGWETHVTGAMSSGSAAAEAVMKELAAPARTVIAA